LNFMAVTEGSKMSVDGGVYDQAVAVYNSLSRRRKSRFMEKGKLPGVLCLVSSKRYPNQFTDIKTREAEKEIAEKGVTTIYVYDRKTWEVLPPKTFIGEWFKVFQGDLTHKPFILEDESKGIDYSHIREELIIDVPIEYRTEFEQDIFNSLRDIAGVSTLATTPFLTNLELLDSMFKEETESMFSTDECDFTGRPIGIKKKFIASANKRYPRFAHIDLGLTSDAAGLAVGHVDKFIDMDMDGEVVSMPHIVIEGLLRVLPPVNGEINFAKIRSLLYMLRNMGLPIRWVTLDSFQSIDTLQILRSKGFHTGIQSMDVKTLPYDITKTAILDERIDCPPCVWLQREIAGLERTERGKIDHLPNGTKDLADSLAGVVYGLTMQNFIWAMFGCRPVGVVDAASYDLDQVSESKYGGGSEGAQIVQLG